MREGVLKRRAFDSGAFLFWAGEAMEAYLSETDEMLEIPLGVSAAVELDMKDSACGQRLAS
jgi:hypothetical protein